MWAKLALFVAIVVGIGWVLKAVGIDLAQLTPDRVRSFVLSFGIWAPVIYLLAYGQPIVPLPASVMTITGGLAFGPLWGALAALGGATVRACSEFLVARLLGREAVAKLLKGKVAQLDQKIGAHGFKTVLLIRLIPNLPFDMQNYGLGFSQVRFGPYALASFLGMIPGSFAYVYLGYSLTDPKQIWKLLLAVLLIVGLMLAQRAWKSRQRQMPATGGTHG
jgi:uncharacterized membrane protein YdjX (TVP38/TMEM64 family)